MVLQIWSSDDSALFWVYNFLLVYRKYIQIINSNLIVKNNQ